jgi:photosystem II stability/assembly factor-like uncharacterized protein
MSANAGKTWAVVSDKLSDVGQMFGFHFSDATHGYMFATGSPTLGVKNFMAQTTDGGKTWILLNSDYSGFYSVVNVSSNKTIVAQNSQTHPVIEGVSFVEQPFDAMTVLSNGTIIGANSYGELDFGETYYKSEDNGITWDTTDLNINRDLFFNDIAFINQNVGFMVAKDLSILKTTDGGKTWTRYVYGGAEGFNKIYAKSADECYVLGNTGRLFHTKDGGKNWTYEDLYNMKLFEMDFPTVDTGYISSSKCIFRTIDGGETWKKFSQNTGGGFIEFPTKDTGFVGYTTGVSNIFKTINAGETWGISVDMTYINAKESSAGGCRFRSSMEGLVTGSSNVLLHTTNGGVSWSTIAIDLGNGTANDIIDLNGRDWIVIETLFNTVSGKKIAMLGWAFKKDTNTVYIISAVMDSVLCTIDGGETWNMEYDSLFWKVSFPNPNICYSTFSTVLYKKVLLDSLQIESFDYSKVNKTCTLTVSMASQETEVAIELYNTDNEVAYVISGKDTLESGKLYTIQIPDGVPDGNYIVRLLPIISSYVGTQTEPFEIKQSTAIEEVTETSCFYIKDKSVVSTIDEDVQVFDMLGQRMPVGKPLHEGVYMVVTKQGAQKVVVK